jgi:hypothetical protein
MRRKKKRGSYREVKALCYLVEVAKKLREKPMRPSELESELKISHKNLKDPHKTLDRVTSCLEAIGVVRKRGDGRLGWVEDWQIFLDGEGYMVKLNHSRELLKPFIERSRSELTVIGERDLRSKYLIQHLQSGYPEVYREYEEWLKSEKNYEERRKMFEDAVMGYAARHGFEIVEYGRLEAGKRQVSHLIYDALESHLRYKTEVKVAWKDGEVWDEVGVALARDEGLVREVEELLRGMIRSENIARAFREMKEAGELRDKARFSYEKDLEWLGLRVRHGEPLKGYCDLCPRVVVEKM